MQLHADCAGPALLWSTRTSFESFLFAGLAVGLHDEATAQLASQALSMLLSLVHSHAKGNQGAAQGLGPVAALIPSILSALAQAPLDDAIAFCHRAMDPFGYGVHAGVAAALAEPLVAGLSRGVMSGDAAQQGACLTALAHLLSANENQVGLCHVFRPLSV